MNGRPAPTSRARGEAGETSLQKGSGEIILYRTEDGVVEIQLQAMEGSVWLTQLEIAELFATTKQNVSLHVRNILHEGELEAASVVKESLTTATDGKQYRTKLFNLHMILAVGYWVRSPRGTQFRQWATRHFHDRFDDFDAQRRKAEALIADAEDLKSLEAVQQAVEKKGDRR
ncbi:MAG: virulence RhuM family protein [Nitrospirae bacterium]|nr:virulence RhuM family protein [Magnetococcales bacterium]HAT48842.1 hypothetical protein [Alphaproteobacteria bacterium]